MKGGQEIGMEDYEELLDEAEDDPLFGGKINLSSEQQDGLPG